MNIWRVVDFLPHSISSVSLCGYEMSCVVNGVRSDNLQIFSDNYLLHSSERKNLPWDDLNSWCSHDTSMCFSWWQYWCDLSMPSSGINFFNFPIQSTPFRFPGSPTNNLVLILLSFSELARFSLWCHLVDLNKFT